LARRNNDEHLIEGSLKRLCAKAVVQKQRYGG